MLKQLTNFLNNYCDNWCLKCYPMNFDKECKRITFSLECTADVVYELLYKKVKRENIIVTRDFDGMHLVNIKGESYFEKNIFVSSSYDNNKSYYLGIYSSLKIMGIGIDYYNTKTFVDIFVDLEEEVLKNIFFPGELSCNFSIVISQKEAIYKAILNMLKNEHISCSESQKKYASFLEIEINPTGVVKFHGYMRQLVKNLKFEVIYKSFEVNDGFLSVAIIKKI